MSQSGYHDHSPILASTEDVDSATNHNVSDETWRSESTELARLREWAHLRPVNGDDDERSSSSSKDYKDDDSLLSEDSEQLVRQPSPGDAVNEDEAPPPPPVVEKEKPVAWSDLPKKSQLAILTLARLSEPLAQTSLQSYMFYQLKSFKLSGGSSPSDETVARQAGILAVSTSLERFTTPENIC